MNSHCLLQNANTKKQNRENSENSENQEKTLFVAYVAPNFSVTCENTLYLELLLCFVSKFHLVIPKYRCL